MDSWDGMLACVELFAVANPLFFTHLDTSLLTEPSLLADEPVKKSSKNKKVHWVDEDEGLPLTRSYTYMSNWDRSPIMVSYKPRPRKKSPNITNEQKLKSFYVYACVSALVVLILVFD
jgi:hypothetical protein